jgi:hypothetical protein
MNLGEIIVNELKKQLPAIEKAVEAAIDAKSDAIVAGVLAKLAELIPGKLDDIALEAAKPELQKIVKAELLKQANKIDGDPA